MTRKYSKEIPGKKLKSLKLWLRLNICLSPFGPPKVRPWQCDGYLWAAERDRCVQKAALWIHTWCLSQMGWMAPPTRAGRSSYRKALIFSSTDNGRNNIVGKCSSP